MEFFTATPILCTVIWSSLSLSSLQVPVESEMLIDSDLVLEQNISPASPVMAGFRLDGFSAIKSQLIHSPRASINTKDTSSIMCHDNFLSPAVLHIKVFSSQVLSTPNISCICKYRIRWQHLSNRLINTFTLVLEVTNSITDMVLRFIWLYLILSMLRFLYSLEDNIRNLSRCYK